MAREGEAQRTAVATGADLRAALLAASAWLGAQAERVDALNVFPVPDGDTGTNMSLTLRAAAEAVEPLPTSATAGEVAQAAYRAAMLGARGNSGVILSQLLRGFADALDGKQTMSARDLADALAAASESAYRAVSRPVEGTILTVARAVAEAARAPAETGADLATALEQVAGAAETAVAATPSQLDVLRRAGVVDAGGEGYRVILDGAWRWATGQPLDLDQAAATAPTTRAWLDAPAEETSFGFCTEFLLRDSSLPEPEVRAAMEALGESVLVVGDGDLLRVHVHTLRPGRALDFAVDHGTVVKVKVENMALQNQALQARTDGTAEPEPVPTGATGVIAVAAGDGLKKVFRSLGASVVEGGQSMNPSVQDILAAADRTGHQGLIVLPNNPNIVSTARSAQTLCGRRLEVVPTESVPQGVAALLAFDPEADLETNLPAMAQAARAVHTVEVTRAVRAAEVDGVAVRAGEAMGLYDGRLLLTDASVEQALLRVLERVASDSLEIVTIYVGADATEAAVQAVAGRVRAAHPGLAVEVVPGDQPHYPYLASIE
jgi:uncharacterized protein